MKPSMHWYMPQHKVPGMYLGMRHCNYQCSDNCIVNHTI